MKREKGEPSPKEEKWTSILEEYQFITMDDFDAELAKYVDTGVLDVARISARAQEQNENLKNHQSAAALEQAWRPFHDSFENNVDEVTASIVKGLKASVAVVSLFNLNAAVAVLHQLGKSIEATDVMEFFVTQKPRDFWSLSSDPFLVSGELHPTVVATMASQEAKATAEAAASFDLESALIGAAQSYNNDAIKKLSEISVDQYYHLIKSKRGDDLRRIVLSGVDFRKISNATPEMQKVVQLIEKALMQIASESTLNAIRVRKYGVRLP
jgi:hypothetical protein